MVKDNAKTVDDLMIRSWDFENDYENVIELLDKVFEKELEQKGLNVKVIFDEYKSMMPLFKFMGLFSRNYKHFLDGYVAENTEGKIVASVNVSYSIYYWEIGMVATHPEYRRKGLARTLVTKAIEHAKECGGKVIGLEVLDINEPAYNLYRNLGFTHYDSITRKKIDFSKLSNLTSEQFPSGYELKEVKKNKQIREQMYKLDLKVTPKEVQEFIEVDRRKYFKPLLVRIIRPLAKLLLKVKRFEWLIYKNESLIGYTSVFPSQKEGSPHRIDFMIDSTFTQELSEPLLSFVLNILKNNTSLEENTIVEFRTHETNLLDAARKYGFEDVETMHLLAIKVED